MWMQYWERNVYGMVIMINIHLSTYWNKYIFESCHYSEQQYWWILYITSCVNHRNILMCTQI